MTQNLRNPLGVAFGSACKLERVAQGISVEEMAAKLGIKPSFYKLVENGANYLHTNKSPAIVSAFNGSMVLDGVSKMLLAISHSEAAARNLISQEGAEDNLNYLNGFQTSIKQLCKMDPDKLGQLLFPYQDTTFSEKLIFSTAKDTKDTLQQYGLISKTQEFLKYYDSWGQSDGGLKSNALIKKIESLPSMYLDIFSDLATRLGNLPNTLGFEEMWKWEKDNQHLFKDWWCLQDCAEKVICQSNLKRYHYNHLWEKNFERGHILFIRPANDEALKHSFSTIIKDLLSKSTQTDYPPEIRMSDAPGKLKSFNQAMGKMFFKSLSHNPDTRTKTLCEEVLPEDYSAFWVFRLIDDSLVGFYAKVTDSDNPVRHMLTVGVSLDHRTTARKLDYLIQLWENC